MTNQVISALLPVKTDSLPSLVCVQMGSYGPINFLRAASEDSEQTGQLPRLI